MNERFSFQDSLEPNLKEIIRKQNRKSWLTGFTLAFAIVLSLMFVVFAFIQKSEAEKSKIETQVAKKEASESKLLAQQQMRLAMENQQLLQEKIASLQRQLEACKK